MAKKPTSLTVKTVAPTASEITVKVTCDECEGSGVYQGFAEKKGEAVVCEACDGEGCYSIRYTPFKGRAKIEGVDKVYWSAGSTLGACGPIGSPVTYKEFLAGKMPKKPRRSRRGRTVW